MLLDLFGIQGPWLELGGPTDHYLHGISDSIAVCPGRLIVSNIKPEFPNDRFVDATDLGGAGFEQGSIGIIFWSALPIDIRQKVWQQSALFIRDGGLVIAQYIMDDDLVHAIMNGFKVLSVHSDYASTGMSVTGSWSFNDDPVGRNS